MICRLRYDNIVRIIKNLTRKESRLIIFIGKKPNYMKIKKKMYKVLTRTFVIMHLDREGRDYGLGESKRDCN